jgi:hypothetical protein
MKYKTLSKRENHFFSIFSGILRIINKFSNIIRFNILRFKDNELVRQPEINTGLFEKIYPACK